MPDFYTRNGDDGYTGLLGPGRVSKYDLRLEAIGALDETVASLGLARSTCHYGKSAEIILATQRDLYLLMAEVSATPENAEHFRKIDARRVSWLEEQINQLSNGIYIPNEFIVPGDSPSGANLDLARAVTRRAERRVAQLFHLGEIENGELLRYLNRLSSLCFILELVENQVSGKDKPTLMKE